MPTRREFLGCVAAGSVYARFGLAEPWRDIFIILAAPYTDDKASINTKGGKFSLTKAIALDYAPRSIRVNEMSPASVWTPMLRERASEQPDGRSPGSHSRPRLVPDT